jgi:putative pyruvate formate lyase activating enzyme
LQNQGCHNINFVTPTHYTAVIIAALPKAIDAGLCIPIVWNCGGYESLETLKLLDGIVDIYMPDFKFSKSDPSQEFMNAADYPEVAMAAIKEMGRQVGNLQMDQRGIAYRGLLIRHLVMPQSRENTEGVLDFIADQISTDTYVNVMEQYRPMYQAKDHEELSVALTRADWLYAVEYARSLGLVRGLGV